MAKMALLSFAGRDSGQHRILMHKKTTTKFNLVMIYAPFFLDAAQPVYIIMRPFAIQKYGNKVFM
jgi:hypothetical protein